MKKFLDFLLARARERSTWLGLVSVATALGIVLSEFQVEAVIAAGMSLAGVTLAFDSLPDREYEIQWTPRLGQSWRTITNVWSQGERTSLVVPHPDPASPSGFFRIRVK